MLILTATACDGTGAGPPPTSVALELTEAAEARNLAADAILSLLTGGPIATSTTGTFGGLALTIEGRIDPSAGDSMLDESIAGVRNQYVLVDDVLYARIYGIDNPGPDGEPAFTVLEPGPLGEDFRWGPLLAAGRVFGDVAVFTTVLRDAAGQVLSLGSRDGDAAVQQGYRFVFDSLDVGRVLVDQGQPEVLLPQSGEDTTTIEIWIDDIVRELSTTGSLYQDGELIDGVQLTISIDPLESAEIVAPSNTAR